MGLVREREATNVVKRNSNISLHSKWLLYQHDKKEEDGQEEGWGGERNKLTRIDLSGVLHLEQNRKKDSMIEETIL